ncbi:DUF334 domain-containing protein [Staphylococcus felis]|uniref:DUF334 domain-containing protein n=1 Tax=Staphylococcus felis TaxID=46127 RepID=UPI00237A7EAE|nr:DUF334 domain-containing protein [Staphylococcus felis]
MTKVRTHIYAEKIYIEYDKLKASEGFMTFVRYIAYGLPYILAIGLFIVLYEWIRAKFHD